MTSPGQEPFRTLKQNHIALLGLIDDILGGVSGSLELTRKQYLGLKPQWRLFQNVLFNHYSVQNKEFYDYLKQNCSDPTEVKKIEFLIEDLKDSKIAALLFFDQHPSDMGDINPKDFKSGFYIFASRIKSRISAERDLLLPLLEKSGV